MPAYPGLPSDHKEGIAAIVEMNKLIAKLQGLAVKASKEKRVSVAVGYTQSYAIYVHENLQAQHKEGKQAKYLEEPFRRLASEGTLAGIIAAAWEAGKTVAQAMLLAGLRVQRESMKVVPIDTGALKNSAFTSLEVGNTAEVVQNTPP
jgi:hypothetical protein